MKKVLRLKVLALSLVTTFSIFFLVLILGISVAVRNASSSGAALGGQMITLTAEEIAQKAGISVERAEDVLLIANWQLGNEQFSIAGTSGSLAVAERESGFDPKAVNPSGGVAGYFQWSGWDNQINGNRWASASQKKLDPEIELQLMSTELNGSFSHVKVAMQEATNAKEAAKVWSEKYEGVSLSDGQTNLTKLEKDAEKWYNILKDNVSSAPVAGGGTLASSFDFPAEYKGKLKYGQPTQKAMTKQPGSGYPDGQCTWYVYNRLMEIGMISVSDGLGYLGNGQDWVGSLAARGWKKVPKARVGAVVSEAYGAYGHVMFVEYVNPDGSFLISECNYAGNQSQVHFRVITHASNLTYAVKN